MFTVAEKQLCLDWYSLHLLPAVGCVMLDVHGWYGGQHGGGGAAALRREGPHGDGDGDGFVPLFGSLFRRFAAVAFPSASGGRSPQLLFSRGHGPGPTNRTEYSASQRHHKDSRPRPGPRRPVDLLPTPISQTSVRQARTLCGPELIPRHSLLGPSNHLI